MIQTPDPIVLSVPRGVLDDISHLSADLLDRMHELLERNTDGKLSPVEKSQLDTLVRMAQFGQIVSSALQAAGRA